MKKALVTLGLVVVSTTAFAGFASNEVFLASIGRGGGGNGAQFYSTLWVTNLSSSATVHFTFFFLKDGQSNLTGDPSFNDTLAPGQTKLYENVTETKLSLPGQFGAARITADGEIFASERVYNLAHATDNLGTSEGLFFAAVPTAFAIGLGETASIQGVNQGSPTENMRTNFDLVETTGNSCKVHVTLLDQNGTSQGATDVNMNPYGHAKENAQALLHSVNTINGRIVATVTSGSGKVILAGEQLGNTSQDSSGFEMSFKDSLLGGNTGGNCTLCVTSLNGLTGAVTIAAGSNVTVNQSGQTITIAATGGGGGLTLPFSGSADSAISVFSINNTDTGIFSTGILGTGAIGVSGKGSGVGVFGKAPQDLEFEYLPFGIGVVGIGESVGVLARSPHGDGVDAGSDTDFGVFAISTSGTAGVKGEGDSSDASSSGVFGLANGNGAGVFGQANHGVGVVGQSLGGTYGVFAYGGFGGTGGKYFVEPHPTDPTKEIRYVCLEGRESGTYFRGTGKIVNGFASIEVPEDFRMVTAERGLTVVVTPVGGLAMLAAIHQGLDKIVIQGSSDVEFNYMVNGVRKAFENHEPISENRDFIPSSADDTRLVASLPAESVRRLKANGTLNEDGSINVETAHRLGWDQRPGWGKKAKVKEESK